MSDGRLAIGSSFLKIGDLYIRIGPTGGGSTPGNGAGYNDDQTGIAIVYGLDKKLTIDAIAADQVAIMAVVSTRTVAAGAVSTPTFGTFAGATLTHLFSDQAVVGTNNIDISLYMIETTSNEINLEWSLTYPYGPGVSNDVQCAVIRFTVVTAGTFIFGGGYKIGTAIVWTGEVSSAQQAAAGLAIAESINTGDLTSDADFDVIIAQVLALT